MSSASLAFALAVPSATSRDWPFTLNLTASAISFLLYVSDIAPVSLLNDAE